MEFLQNLADITQVPFLYAFILGLMTAISPCPLATNITAIAYISREISNKRKIFLNGLLYTLGRAASYATLGVILFFGASKFHVTKIFQSYGEMFLGPLLILLGIFMLDIIPLSFPSLGKFSEKWQSKFKNGSSLSAFLLGLIFALAFCPYSGVLFFGMLMPLTIANAAGLYLPVVFALATGLPVIIIAYLLAFSISSIGSFYNKIKTFQKWFNRVVAAVFIAVGVYYVYWFYIQKYISA